MKIRRPKVAAACHECRARKVKCDGKIPVCEPCNARGASEACRWDPDPIVSKRKTNTARVSHLEKRLKDLESLYSTHQQTRSHREIPLPNLTTVTEEPAYSVRRDFSSSSIPADTQQRLDFLRPNDRLAVPSGSDEQFPRTTEAEVEIAQGTPSQEAPHNTTLGITATFELVHPMIGSSEEQQSQEFFGKSSASTFMRNVKRLVEKRLGCTVTSTDRTVRSPSIAQGDRSIHRRDSFSHTDYILPPRNVADKLMTFYWEFLHPTMPYLNPIQMQDEYESLWNGTGMVQQERSFHCLLNVIFAISSQLNEFMGIQERLRMATMFYQRARRLLDVLDRGSLRAVQYCLLLGEYFQGTTDPHSAWMYIGLAIRTAQSLGIHRPETSQRTNDSSQRELLRRLWHGCILMDRSMSVSYGRPCMIGPKSALAVPLPSPLEELQDVTRYRSFDVDNNHGQQLDDFYVCCLKLYEVLHDVAFNFYSINSRGEIVNLDNPQWSVGKSEANSCTLELEKKLSKWEESLPDHLKVEMPRDEDSKYRRQAIILHQRKLHVRILLLRPILSDILQVENKQYDRAHRPLSSRIIDQYGIACVETALESIQTIHRELFLPRGEIIHLSAWYHNTLYLYTSATILIAALHCPAILNAVNEATIRQHWTKALESLEKYHEFDPTILQLITTLKVLFTALPHTAGNSAMQENPRTLMKSAYNEQQNPSLTEPAPISPAQTFQPFDAQTSLTDASVFEDLLNFDVEFDLNDTSWLTTLPYDNFMQF